MDITYNYRGHYMSILDLSTNEIDTDTASIFKTMGVRLFVNYHENKIYVNKVYWSSLPDIAQEALVLILQITRKEFENEQSL
jgi:hypothetical protein